MATNGNPKKKYETLKLGPTTGAYVQGLFEASAMDDGQEPKYSLTLIIPKNTPKDSPLGKSFAALQAKIVEVAKEKFGPASVEQIKKNMAGFKNFPIRDGDVDKSDKPEFANSWFISVKSKNRPGLVNRHLTPITDKDEVWSGCKFVVDVGVFSYDIKNKQGASTAKGVAVGLNHALMYEKGERIDNRKSAEETFAEFAGDAPQEEESALD